MRDRGARRWATRAARLILLSVGIGFTAAPARADVIDFETGFIDQDPVTGPITTPTNSVRFRFGAGTPSSDGFIARVGAPQTAFFPDDLPSGGTPGDYFLSDESALGGSPSTALDAFIEFAEPVSNLSLELYDLELDGNTATLTAYADLARTQVVGTDSETISGTAPEGLVLPLSIPAPTTVIRAATLTTSNPADTGTGIDNVTFITARVPIPGAALVVLGLLLFGTSYVALRRS